MSIWNILFPAKCVFCRDTVESGAVFCPICFAKYEQMKRRRCLYCGKTHNECRCVSTKLRMSSLPVRQRHIFSFKEDMARTIVYKLKRRNLTGLQDFLCRECAHLVKEEIREGEKVVIVYPPRSKRGIMKYGFDQACILANGIGKILDIPVLNIFLHKGSGEQKTLSATERMKNASGAYFLKEGADLEGFTVVIVDDVVTSGSTALALCRLSSSAGAKRTIVVSVSTATFG